jgi:GNAT superfamily N-acetyltransferase
VELRELRDEDVGGVVQLLREASPHQLLSEVGFRHRLATSPPRANERRWVAVDGNDVVGAAGGQLHVYAERADNAFVGTTVRADHRRRGVGGELFARAVAHVREAGAVRAVAESGEEDGRGFLERRGFTKTTTRRYSRVDPRDVDLSGLAELRARKEGEGFTVVPFTACRPEDVHAVDEETTVDIPLDVPVSEMPLDDWLAQYWRNPLLTHEGSFAVLHEGRPVTVALVRADGDRAMNDMTGTLRPFRGRGLARLVKLCQLEWAARAGIVSVVTENDEKNAPMLAVNTQLGYRPFLDVTTFVRELA